MTLKKGWCAVDWDCPDGVDALEAIRGATRSYEAREIVGETKEDAHRGHAPPECDVPGRVQAWIASLKDADLEGKRRILHIVIAESDEWQQLGADAAGRGRRRHQGYGTEASMSTVILGRYDDRKMAWREPPDGAVDTSEPDVVSLETLLADPPELTTTVARGLAFAGCVGFVRGPKASGQDDGVGGGGRAR